MAKQNNNIFKAPSIKMEAPKKNTTTMVLSGGAFKQRMLDQKCAILTPGQLAQLFSDPAFCTTVVDCVESWLGTSGVDPVVASEICAYLGGLSQNNSPVSGDKIVLGSCEYATIKDVLGNNTTVELSLDSNNDLIVTVNGVASTPIDISIDCSKVVSCVEAAPALVLNNVTTDDLVVTGALTLPAGSVTHTVVGNTSTVTVGGVSSTASVVTSNDVSLTGTVLTSNVNGVTDSVDLADLLNSATFQSNDDQVLTASATSDFAITLTPTTVTDPDSQVNKVNYELSATAKPTVICSGNPLSATNKLLTTDTLTTNVTAPVTVVATPDETIATNTFVKAVKVNTGCNEDIYIPLVKNPIVRNYVTTPTSIVDIPTVPTVVNAGGKDIYRATVTYTVTAPTSPTGSAYFYTISTKGKYQIDKINYPVSAYSYILGTGISQSAEEELNIPVANAPINYQKLQATGYVASAGTVTITNVYEIRIDTGQSLQMVGGSPITMTNTTAEFIYYPEN